MATIKTEMGKSGTVELPDSGLLGVDQTPMSRAMQDWGWTTLFFTAVGIAFNIVLIMQGAILILSGNNWQWTLAIMVVTGILLGILFGLSGAPGERLGIPHTVFARAVFGNGLGTYFVTAVRGIVALFFFGIQSWIVAQCIDGIFAILFKDGWTSLASFPRLFALFVLFSGAQYILMFYGYKAFKYLALYGMPLAIVVLIAAVIWMYNNLGSWGPVWGGAADFIQKGGTKAVYLGLAMMFGSWCTLIINFSDLTRKCRIGTRSVMTATGAGYIVGMVISALLGITTLSMSIQAGIGAEWNPVVWASKYPNAVFAILILVLIFIAQITTNPQANMLAPAIALCNMAPKRINLKLASGVGIVLSLATFPWVILAHQSTMFTYLSNVGAVLAGAAFIMIVDYWVVHRAKLDVVALYTKEGPYRFYHGVNLASIIAVLCSIVLGVVFMSSGGTFISGASGVVVYLILRALFGQKVFGSKSPSPAAKPGESERSALG